MDQDNEIVVPPQAPEPLQFPPEPEKPRKPYFQQKGLLHYLSRLGSFCLRHRLLVEICAAILLVTCTGLVFRFCIGTESEVASRTVELGFKDVGKLVTQEAYYTNIQVIDNTRELFGYTVPGTRTKVIFSFDGMVQAGIDFEKVTVETDNDSRIIIIGLPEAEIFTVVVDENSLQIYDESESIFTPLSVVAYQESRVKLQSEVREKAIANGMLENAAKNAQNIISEFVKGIGEYADYTIQFRSAEN